MTLVMWCQRCQRSLTDFWTALVRAASRGGAAQLGIALDLLADGAAFGHERIHMRPDCLFQERRVLDSSLLSYVLGFRERLSCERVDYEPGDLGR